MLVKIESRVAPDKVRGSRKNMALKEKKVKINAGRGKKVGKIGFRGKPKVSSKGGGVATEIITM